MKSFELSVILAYKQSYGYEYEFYKLYPCCWQWQTYEIIYRKATSFSWWKAHAKLGDRDSKSSRQ